VPIESAGISGLVMPIEIAGLRDGRFDSFGVNTWVSVPPDVGSASFGMLKDSAVRSFSGTVSLDTVYRKMDEWASGVLSAAKSGSCRLELSSRYVQTVSGNSQKDLDYIDVAFAILRSATGGSKYLMSVAVSGFNACPCTMSHTSQILGVSPDSTGRRISVTHNQRTRLKARIESPSVPEFDFRRIGDLLRDSMGGRLRELAGDVEEANVVIHAHENPGLIEDVVRKAAIGVSMEPLVDGSAVLIVEGRSLESIHHHNAYARVRQKVSDLRSLSA